MKILAIDPGVTCGVAIFENDKLIEAIEITEEQLLTYIELNKYDVIVIEGYYNYPWIKNRVIHNYPVAELIGKLKLLSHQLNIKIIIQPAGLVKSVVTEAVLKHFKIKEYKSKHITDAIKHGIYYIKYRKT